MVAKKERVVLVHGFHRTYRDMAPLKKELQARGYRVSRVNLPLTFTTIEDATEALIDIAERKLKTLGSEEKVHLVGHSTGGLIIRHFLAVSDFLPYVGRCVLIATPNRGYKLADQAAKAKYSKTYFTIYKTMKSLQTEEVRRLALIGDEVEIGAIAGTKSIFPFSQFIEGINDGRIETEAVKYDELKDFITLPFQHNEIHKKPETAELVDRFLKTGSFE